MKPLLLVAILLMVSLFSAPVMAQDVLNYLKDTYPKHALKSALEARKNLNKEAKLDAKTLAFIALGETV